jgi:hypothetical protein
MKYAWSSMVLLLGAVAISLAQEEAPPGAEAPPQGPRITCDAPEFNFGSADSQSTVEHTFVLRNIGDTTLEISQVRPACGCTVADISSRSVPPGQESRVTARLNLQGRSGHQSKAIMIHSNDPETPILRLNMEGDVSQSTQVSPERLMFGQLGPGQSITQLVEITAMAAETFTILQVEATDPNLHVVSETVEEGRKYRIPVVLTGLGKSGSFNANVRVTTDNPTRPTIDIPVFANIIADIIYAPAEIVLPAQTDGAALTRYAVIRPGNPAINFEITSVTPPSPEITAKIFPFGQQGYRIQFENIIPAAELDGKEIRIVTTAPQMPEILIPIRINH